MFVTGSVILAPILDAETVSCLAGSADKLHHIAALDEVAVGWVGFGYSVMVTIWANSGGND